MRAAGVRRVFASLDAIETAGRNGDPSPAGAAAPSAPVVFSCDNPRCLIGISVASTKFAFFSQQGSSLPVGVHRMGWKGTSSPSGEAFEVTVQGATLDSPISSVTGPDSGGIRRLTVTAS